MQLAIYDFGMFELWVSTASAKANTDSETSADQDICEWNNVELNLE